MAQQKNSQSRDDSNLPSSAVHSKRSSRLRSRAVPESAFNRYMKSHYAEHFRRISSWRRAAKWSLFTYPVASALALATPCAGLYAGVQQLYRLQPGWFSNFLSPETQSFVLPGLLILCGVALFFGLILGIGFGISRARMLNFEAERTELNVRHSYFLRRIARSKKTAARHMAHHQNF
ncbi:MAG: hypothetical protein FJY29_03225 [Betaproteobacteria bacterium]|nr:hypothetical protein [Betaproteobacteria bacterium]